MPNEWLGLVSSLPLRYSNLNRCQKLDSCFKARLFDNERAISASWKRTDCHPLQRAARLKIKQQAHKEQKENDLK